MVVASRNRRHLLRRFVEAVSADPATTEVIVVLDGDADGSFALLTGLQAEFPALRPILVDQGGQLGALDRGVACSTGDVVLLMDDDVIAGPGLVSGHALHHREATADHLVVMGYMPVGIAVDSAAASRLYAREYDGHCARIESGQLPVLKGLWFGNVSARREDLVAVGLKSEEYPMFWHSDLDVGLRLSNHGCVGTFDRSLRATHMHAQSSESFLNAAHQRGEAVVMLEQHYPEYFSIIRPAPLLDGLPGPARHVVSYLGREGRAQRTGRALMSVGAASDRLGITRVSDESAKLARRILILCGTRCADGPATE